MSRTLANGEEWERRGSQWHMLNGEDYAPISAEHFDSYASAIETQVRVDQERFDTLADQLAADRYEDRACYATVSVIVAGALDSEATVLERDWDVYLGAMLSAIDRLYASDGQPTEVYVLWHQHDMGVECECIQYATTHQPDYVWGEQS